MPLRPFHNGRVMLLILLFLLLAEIAVAVAPSGVSSIAARAAFVCICIFGAWSFGPREKSLLIAAFIVGILSFVFTKNGAALASGLDLAAFLGAFIVALTAIRNVAARSGSLKQVGHFLTHQPAGKRFFTIAFGGQILGFFLNFGAASLMAPMLREGTKSPKEQQRQLSTLVRGFAWVIIWAPTTLTQALMLSLFPELSWRDTLPLGIATAVFFVFVGRVYDRWEWPRPPTNPTVPIQWPRAAMVKTGGICTTLIVATLLGNLVTGASVALVLIFVAPLVTVVWFSFQPPVTVNKVELNQFLGLATLFSPAAYEFARTAVALGLSGFIGRAIALSLPIDQWADFLDLSKIPAWLFLALIPVFLSLGGQIAMSPILLIVLFGEILHALPNWPTGAWQIAFALSTGWALSMMSAPNASATLLLASSVQIPPTVLTWHWNLKFAVLCYLLLVPIYAVIA